MRTRTFIPFALGLFMASWIFLVTLVSVNITPSMPRGIYLRLPVTGDIRVGDIVEFQNPMPEGYMGMNLDGVPLLKHVVAVSDDGTQLIVRGESERSYDSRYFGPLDASLVEARVYPLITESGPVGDHIIPLLLDKEQEE